MSGLPSIDWDLDPVFVTVPQGGSIEVFFGSRQGSQPPIVNGVRVTHRPDR